MSIRSSRTNSNQNTNRKTTKLGIEQLESRLMNSIDNIESGLQLLNSPGVFGSTQIVSSDNNTPPTVAVPLQLPSGSTVLGRTATLNVLGADNAGESRLKYNWSTVAAPSGGTIQFATNRTNAAKSNTLTFNKVGTYQVLVTIADAQGLTTSSSLTFSVEQKLTSFVVKSADGRSLTSASPLATSDIRTTLTVQGLDQFGNAMSQQPDVTWESVSVPARGTATLTTTDNSLSVAFNRAGTYVIKAKSGTVSSSVSVRVNQALTFINLADRSGAAIDPSQAVSVTTRSNQFIVRGFDQFGDAMTTMPRVTFTATAAPSGGSVAATLNAGVTTLAFSKSGSYSIVAQSGQSSFSFTANVIPTFTSIALRNGEGRAITGTLLSTTARSVNLSAFGLDQFGILLDSQPVINWVKVSVPSGGDVTLESSENGVSASFSKAGSYRVQAVSGSVVGNLTIAVNQAVTELRVSPFSGASSDPSSPIAVTTTNQKLRVQAFDQFGNATTTLPSITWTTTAAPVGATARASDASGTPTITFSKAGFYTLRVNAGLINQSISFEVSRTFTKIVAYTIDNRPVASTATVMVSGADLKLTAKGFDQFGQAMPTDPTFEWSTVSSPTGATATLTQSDAQASFVFERAGSYRFRATSLGITVNVTISVLQTATTLTVTPGTASIATRAKQQFRYQVLDQFGQTIASPAAATWTTTGGTISSSGLLTASAAAGTFTVTAKSGRLVATASVEVTSSTPTPTPTPTPNPTPSGQVQNAALANLISTYYADSQLSRTEVMQLLKSAGNDGVVDATELADLRYITGSTSVYAMPAYVRELAKDVVNSNPANLKFKGQTAGNLAAGSSATLLNNLVDKWFLGVDVPMLSGSGVSYQTVVGNLFNGVPSRADAKQGQLGDCYFIAALSAIADKNPDAVRNLFIDNSDGTYTVRFYVNSVADYVTVNRSLATRYSTLFYSGYGQSITSTSTTLWIALAEKAYAQWNETGNSGRDGTNRMAAIEGGWMSYVNAQVLGYASSNYSFASTPKQTLIDAINSGKSVTLGTKTGSGNGLVGGHAYIVTGYNAANDTFTTYNPWGTTHAGALTYAQLQTNCSMFTVTDPSNSVANNLASVRSSSETFVGNWTTVVLVQVQSNDELVSQQPVELLHDPMLAVLGSEFHESAETPQAVAMDSSVDQVAENQHSSENKMVATLTASLVDLAMSELV